MDKDRFPTLSDPEDDDNSFGSIIKRSSPKPFNFGGLVPEATLFSQSQEKEEDDDDDEEDSKATKKQKKFTQLLKSIFPKSIEDRPKSTESPTIDTITDHEEVFSEINTPTAYEAAAEAQTLLEPPERSEVDHQNQLPELQPTLDNSASEIQADPGELPQISNPEQSSAEPELDAKDNSLARAIYPPVSAPPIFSESYNRSFAIDSPTPAKETVVVEKQKPMGAILAFLGAEFFSRRRDKKLERAFKKQSKELNSKIEDIKPKTSAPAPESLGSILERANYASERKQYPVIGANTEVPTSQFFGDKTMQTGADTRYTRKNFLPREVKNSSNVNIPKSEMSTAMQTRSEYKLEQPRTNPEQPNVENQHTPENFDQSSFEAKKDSANSKKTNNIDPNSSIGSGAEYYSPAYSRQSNKVGSVVGDQNTQSSAKTTDYKQSIQVGAGMALIILAIFIVIYISR